MKKRQQMVINDIDTNFCISDEHEKTNFQELIEAIKNQYKFPPDVICRIEIDGKEKQNHELVSAYAKQKINVKCSHIIPINLMHPYLGSITVRADLCQQIIELEKLIAQQIYPIKYEILLNDNIPEKNKFLSQINYEKLILKLNAPFYVTHENVQKIFTVEAFQQCQAIKKEVFNFFKITDEADLVYDKVALENQEIFASYQVKPFSEIKIQIKTQITLTIKYNEILHKFSTRKNQKIQTIIESLRKYFSLHEDQKIFLRYRGSNLNSKKTLEESSITQDVTMELKLDPITLQLKVRVFLKGQKIYFLQFVGNNQCVSVLDKKLPLKNKTCTYYLGDKQLNQHVSFIENGINDVQEIDLSVEIIDKEQIMIRFEGQYVNHVKVFSTDAIQQALKQFNPNNQTITAYYYNKQIEINQTYISLGIQDGDTIVYKLTDKNSDYMITINRNLENIEFNSNNTGKQLIEYVQKQFKIKNQCKLLYGGRDCPLDKVICDFEEENQIFELIQLIPIRIYVESTKRSLLEYFYEDQKIEDLKSFIRQKFEVADDVQIIISIDDEIKEDSIELGIFQETQLDVKFLSLLKLKLVDLDGKLIKELVVEKTSSLRKILNSFNLLDQQQDFRSYYKKILLDNDQEFQENLQNETEATIEIEFLKKGNLISKQDEQINIQIFFYQDQNILDVISQYLGENFQIYYNSKIVEKEQTFKKLNIQSECTLYYDMMIDVQITNQFDKILMRKPQPFSSTLQMIISEFTKYEVEIFFEGELQVQNKQLKEFIKEDAEEYQKLEFKLIELISITIEYDQKQKTYKFPRSNKVKILREKKEYIDKSKQFYYQDSQVEENKEFAQLYKDQKQVTLVFRDEYQNLELLHQPSINFSNYQIEVPKNTKKETKPVQQVVARQNQAPIQQFPNKIQNSQPKPSIKIQEIPNQQKQPELQQQNKPNRVEEIKISISVYGQKPIFENVDINMTLGDFFTYFEKKHEISDYSLFYDGKTVDCQKTFKQLNIQDEGEFEIY